MSKKGSTVENEVLQDVKVEPPRSKRRESSESPYEKRVRSKSKTSNRSSDFVYVNNAYVGSLNSVNEPRVQAPPTSVIREQYWTCSKWPTAQRVLAVLVGILLGAVIGLALTVGIRTAAPELDISGIFRSSAPD